MVRNLRVHAVGRPEVIPLEMPERFRLEVVYFMTPTDRPGAPILAANEYWIEPTNVETWLEEGVFSVVSPLDAETVADIELSDDQERWLEWLKQYSIDRVRIERPS
ncbi:MAG: hypothetical protein WCI02_07100 [Planctomycetota bacterium]|jgi:hypothetical protein